MDALMRECSELVSRLPSVLVSDRSTINFQPCRSLTYGDIVCVGRRITTEEEGEIGAALRKTDVFTSVKCNRHGQLCVALNRPRIFHATITELLDNPSKYGLLDTTSRHPMLITDYFTRPGDNGPGTTGSHQYHQQLSVSEGRLLLVKKLIIHVLKKTGHRVKEGLLMKMRLESHDRDLVPDDVVLNFFRSFSDSDFSSPPSVLASEEDKFLRHLETSDYVSYSRHSLICDGYRFIQEKGKHFDKNIEEIKVRNDDGSLTTVASLASQLLAMLEDIELSEVIHATNHSSSFRLQQAMVLAEVACIGSEKRGLLSQHLVLCSDVEVLEDGLPVKNYPLAQLLQVRHKQMMDAFSAKCNATADDPDVRAMTEAVVKFELLSTDPQAKIKLTVPSQARGGDARFAGSFVLYNYARLATILNSFERACTLGTYPPLPEDLAAIDFSLLTDEEEWHILFQFILQYPSIVRDIVHSVCETYLHTKLKKICQFLTQLSHSVSTYYSRVKILMVPEPHLVPLIHARLVLVKAIKQTMYNALQLLAIDPPKQL